MDADLTNALLAAIVEDNDVDQWFALIDDASTEAGDDWGLFVRTLTDSAGVDRSAAVESFLGYVADHDKLDLVQKLVDLDDKPTEYATAWAQAWADVRERYGPEWAYWDRAESTWTEYRDWMYASVEDDFALRAATDRFFAPLDDRPHEQRIDALLDLGFPITLSTPGELPADSDGHEDVTLEDLVRESLSEAIPEVSDADQLTQEMLEEIVWEIVQELADSL